MMSNSLGSTTWKCDTEGVLTPLQVEIKGFYWFAPTTAGDDLILLDKAGEIVLKAVAEANGQSQYFFKGGHFWANGLTLDTLDSGTLFIDIR